MRILFVCLGNICRSPTAEGVMRALVAERGLEDEVKVASAGTGGWHVGHPPDERASAAAAARGIELSGSARRVQPGDLEDFDLVIAMDRSNHSDLLRIAASAEAAERVRLLREFDPEADGSDALDVPDPYHGGEEGFEEVLDIVERSCASLLDETAGRTAA